MISYYTLLVMFATEYWLMAPVSVVLLSVQKFTKRRFNMKLEKL